MAPPVPTPVHSRFQVSERLDEEGGEETEPFVAAALAEADAFTPVPPPATSAQSSSSPTPPPDPTPRRTPFIVGGLGIILASAALIGAGIQLANRTTASPAPSGAPVTLRSANDFDPRADGGSGAENAKRVKRAIDGDPETVWTTERYRRLATFGGLKPGVGLVLDLGEPTKVAAVSVRLSGDGTDVEIRVPAKEVESAPMRSIDQWR